MTVIPQYLYRCDGCLAESPHKDFIAAHYEIVKHVVGQPLTKYPRDYCGECVDHIRAALREGAFKGKVRKELV